jgi:hypothetical protein
MMVKRKVVEHHIDLGCLWIGLGQAQEPLAHDLGGDLMGMPAVQRPRYRVQKAPDPEGCIGPGRAVNRRLLPAARSEKACLGRLTIKGALVSVEQDHFSRTLSGFAKRGKDRPLFSSY